MSSKFSQIHSIFGAKILFLFFASVIFGVSLGVVEIIFSFALQNFFAAFKLIPSGGIPDFLPFQEYPIKLFIGIGLLQLIMNFLNGIIPYIAFGAFERRMRGLITRHALDPSAESNTFSVAMVSHLFSNVLPKVNGFVSAATMLIITAIVMITLLIGMGKISWSLTGIMLAIIVLFNAPMFFLKNMFQSYSAILYKLNTQFVYFITKAIRNIYFLRIVGTAQRELNQLLDINRNIFRKYLRYIFGLQANSTWPIFAGVLIVVAIVLINAQYGLISLVIIIPFIYLLIRFALMVSRLAVSIGQMQFSYPFLKELVGHAYAFQGTISIAHRERKHFSLQQEIPRQLTVSRLAIGRQKPYIENIAFSLHEGDFLLIAGKSGKGKTTLLMTLIGLVDKLEGEILWNSKPLEQIDRDFLRKHIGYSGHDPFLLDDTIEENLLYGSLDRDAERGNIPKALEVAQASFVTDLSAGMKHVLKEGGEGISAGQKQRISIARALLRKPKVLFLDEATANIDEPTEEIILKGIRCAYPNMMIIAVSHRNSLRQFATQLIDI